MRKLNLNKSNLILMHIAREAQLKNLMLMNNGSQAEIK